MTIHLRSFRETDLSAIHEIVKHEELALVAGFECENEQSVRHFISQAIRENEEKTGLYRIIVSEGQTIGYIYLHTIDPEDKSAFVHLCLVPSEWGRGYYEQAMNEILKDGFLLRKLERVYVTSTASNGRALNAVKKLPYATMHVQDEYPDIIQRLEEREKEDCVLHVITKGAFHRHLMRSGQLTPEAPVVERPTEKKESIGMEENNIKPVSQEEAQDFYRKLRGKMDRFLRSKTGANHKYAKYLLFAPDVFYLLLKTATDSRVSKKDRVMIAGAIGYFVLPVDLIPEGLVGPGGYIDDLVIASLVLQIVVNNLSDSIVRDHWAGDEDGLSVINKIASLSDKVLPKRFFGKFLQRVTK